MASAEHGGTLKCGNIQISYDPNTLMAVLLNSTVFRGQWFIMHIACSPGSWLELLLAPIFQ